MFRFEAVLLINDVIYKTFDKTVDATLSPTCVAVGTERAHFNCLNRLCVFLCYVIALERHFWLHRVARHSRRTIEDLKRDTKDFVSIVLASPAHHPWFPWWNLRLRKSRKCQDWRFLNVCKEGHCVKRVFHTFFSASLTFLSLLFRLSQERGWKFCLNILWILHTSFVIILTN